MNLYLFLSIVVIYCFPTEDLVKDYAKFNIPYTGQWFSGYLRINDDGSKQFHYFMFPQQNQNMSDDSPVILWLNGGPGCSSLYGALNENGPFVFNLGTNDLRVNPYSWTNTAHMFYLESPATVGFSYGDEHTSDASSAKDNLQAVIEFFKKFPELSTHQFYISGESYAGTYIPLLANEIIEYNKNATKRINLIGLMIGNGCTDYTECTIEAKRFPIHKFEFMHSHHLISEKLWEEIDSQRDNCFNSTTQYCKDLYAKTQEEINLSYEFYYNPYNIYGKCYQLPITKFNGETIPRSKMTLDPFDRQPGTVPSCSEAQGLFYYFTNPEFVKAINVDTSKLKKEWEDCSSTIKYTKDPRATYYLYPKLIKSGIRILKFSGDVDGVVPITGTFFWLNNLQNEMGLHTIEPWRSWTIPGNKSGEDQNAGNVWILDGLWFVTIRNAGHMVPMDQPMAALIMINNFIYGIPLPY
ncbi:unnamed protein product [Paramecium primaurelia]|uniref:Carboxypeptidase n=1 Tax=Paramecium primaurelia TaxID=5886 RepID=A0A8S1QDA7_PARPR|nr:unnamed protein product [Paramecium primaurelia]